MSYLGLFPAEPSTGAIRRQVHITKTGSRHARRLLIEAAWHWCKPPRLDSTLKHRQEGQDPLVVIFLGADQCRRRNSTLAQWD